VQGNRLLAPADLLAAVEVEEADLAQLGPGCLAPFTYSAII